MKLVSIALVAVAMTSVAQAQPFKCLSEEGVIEFSDTACPQAVSQAEDDRAVAKAEVVAEAPTRLVIEIREPDENDSYACTSAKYNLEDAKSYLDTVRTDAGRTYAEGLVRRAQENKTRTCG